MGGLFSPTQGPSATIGGGAAPALGPFQAQLGQAIAQLFTRPGPGITPLEEATVRGGFTGAMPMLQQLQATGSGQYLPGVTRDAQGNMTGTAGNPFTQGLLSYMDTQGDIARRNLASQAQRSGAFESTGERGYLGQASLLESQLAGQKMNTLSSLWGQERTNQMGAPGQAAGLGQYLLGSAAIPRQVAQQVTMQPYAMGMQFLGPWAGRADVIPPPQQGPSPFATMLGAGMGLAGSAGSLGWRPFG